VPAEEVPTDEGEAEAQVPVPTLTIRYSAGVVPSGFPFDVQLEGPYLPTAKQRNALDDLMHTAVVRRVQENGWRLAHEPSRESGEDEDGARIRVHRFTVEGWEQ